MAQQDYLSSPIFRLLEQRVMNPPSGKPKEHHVGSWLATLLKQVFSADIWAITPEKSDDTTNKKPDFVIEKLEGNELHYHLICEVKRQGSNDRMEDALHQTVEHIAVTMDENKYYEVFVIIQRGVDIGFFEYHNDRSNLRTGHKKTDTRHFEGCVSLTQDTHTGLAVVSLATAPPGIKPLFHDEQKLHKINRTRKRAKKYKYDCIFNIINHRDEINKMLHHISCNIPRPSYLENEDSGSESVSSTSSSDIDME